MRYIKSLMSKMTDNGRRDWSLGTLFEFMKTINKNGNNSDKFPFKAVRAMDFMVSDKESEKYFFASGKENYTYLNPRMVICVYEKEGVILSPTKIVFER